MTETEQVFVVRCFICNAIVLPRRLVDIGHDEPIVLGVESKASERRVEVLTSDWFGKRYCSPPPIAHETCADGWM